MKRLGGILLLAVGLSTAATAVEYDASVSYARIDQNLFGTIEFPMDALVVSGTAWDDSGFGFRVTVGRSTETANNLYVDGYHYTNKINAMYGAMVVYRQSIGNFSGEVGFGKTDYKATWTVNGKVPDWGDNSADSDWSYYAGVTYPINNDVDLSFGYTDIYRKDKEGYGREETRSFSAGFVYNF